MSLPYYIDLEFVHRLPLKNLRKTGNGYRCSCPFCGEGNSPWKARCGILMPNVNHNHVTVYCFNCGKDTNVKYLVKQVAPYLMEEYEQKEKELYIEDLRNGTVLKKIQDVKPEINIITFKDRNKNKEFRPLLQYQFELNELYFRPAVEYEVAVNFCKERKIFDQIHKFKYCIHPKLDCGGMVIFPFYTGYGDTVYGFQGRHPLEKRFHTFSNNEGFKVYGVFEVDHSLPVLVCESIIDSFALINGIAMVGADLSSHAVEQCLKDCKLIFAGDNDKTGLQKAEKYGDLGYSVFIWPNEITAKDFNDLAKEGWSKEDITDMVLENSYSGALLKAKIGFKKMKKG